MTQHEYIFIAVSIILGLAITRLLNNAAMLLRGREKMVFIGPQPSGPSASCCISCSFGGWAGVACAAGMAVYGFHRFGVRMLLSLWGV